MGHDLPFPSRFLLSSGIPCALPPFSYLHQRSPRSPGWPRETRLRGWWPCPPEPSSFPPASQPPEAAQARPAAAADQDQEKRRGERRGEGEREGGWHLPPQAGPAGGRADGGLEASEWPSGKGSVGLGWAEVEDTLLLPFPQLRQGQTEL